MRAALYLSIAASLSLSQLPLAAKADSTPPLLRFAERYAAEHPPHQQKSSARHVTTKKKPAVAKKKHTTRQKKQATTAVQSLQRQQQEIVALKRALSKAQEQARPSQQQQSQLDLSAVATGVKKLRQLTGLTSREKQAREKIAELSQQLAHSQQRAGALVAKYHQMVKQRSLLEKQIQQYRQQQHSEKNSGQTAASRQLKKLEQQLARAQADAEAARAARQQQDKEIKTAHSQLAQLQAASQESNNKVAAAKQASAEIVRLRNQLNAANQQLASVEKNVSVEQQKKIQALTSSREQLKEKLDDANRQLTQTRQDAGSKLKKITQTLKTTQAQLEAANQQLARSHSHPSTEQQKALQALQSTREQLSQKLQDANQQLAQIRQDAASKQQQATRRLQETQAQLDKANQQLAQAQQDADSKLQRSAQALKTLQAQLDTANQQLNLTQKNADASQQKSIQALKDSQQQLNNQLKTANDKLGKLQEQLALSRKDADSAEAERQQTLEKLQDAHNRLNLLQNQLALLRLTSNHANAGADNKQQSAGVSELQKQLDEANARATALQQQLNAAPFKSIPILNQQLLENPAIRQGYAIGISLGAEILLLQQTHQAAGDKVDKNLILAGIIDAFNHQPKLDEKSFTKALADADKLAGKHSLTQTDSKPQINAWPPPDFKPTIRKQDRGFLNAYRKRKGVKKSQYGFWYEILKPGIKPLKPDDTVAIVIEESLTDGTVINDMEKTRQMLSEKLKDYPPLLKAALSKLRSKGVMSMVVPPELAYGKKGLPPKIPANATMVYQIRIAEVWPEGKAPSQQKR